MKSLRTYILESLQARYQKYFKDVYSNMQSLIKDNKIEPIEVNVENIGCPNRPFEFEDFVNDRTVRHLINDKTVGFSILKQMIQIPKKYLTDESDEGTKEFAPECWPFSFNKGTDMYLIGISMFDRKVSYIDNFVHLVGIETSMIVSDSLPVLKEMLKLSVKKIRKTKEYSGITAKPAHPKMKALLLKLGFSAFKENKEILTYKL